MASPESPCRRDPPRAGGARAITTESNLMHTTTLSGPADTVRDARAQLTDAGYFVLSAPSDTWLAVADGDELLSVDGSHSDVARHVERLGWRHRSTSARQGRAVRIGGQG